MYLGREPTMAMKSVNQHGGLALMKSQAAVVSEHCSAFPVD